MEEAQIKFLVNKFSVGRLVSNVTPITDHGATLIKTFNYLISTDSNNNLPAFTVVSPTDDVNRFFTLQKKKTFFRITTITEPSLPVVFMLITTYKYNVTRNSGVDTEKYYITSPTHITDTENKDVWLLQNNNPTITLYKAITSVKTQEYYDWFQQYYNIATLSPLEIHVRTLNPVEILDLFVTDANNIYDVNPNYGISDNPDINSPKLIQAISYTGPILATANIGVDEYVLYMIHMFFPTISVIDSRRLLDGHRAYRLIEAYSYTNLQNNIIAIYKSSKDIASPATLNQQQIMYQLCGNLVPNLKLIENKAKRLQGGPGGGGPLPLPLPPPPPPPPGGGDDPQISDQVVYIIILMMAIDKIHDTGRIEDKANSNKMIECLAKCICKICVLFYLKFGQSAHYYSLIYEFHKLFCII